MSTPPKEPKPGAGPTLEHTFLGVAPAAPEPSSAPPSPPPSSGAPPSSSAIIAAPMISVSADRKARPATAAAAPASPVLPTRPTALQGGWQSAGVARPGPDQTALQGTPAAWPAPSPAQQPAPAAARALPPRPQSYPAGEDLTATRAPLPSPRQAGPAPGAAGGLHHTALASDYLRGARDAALGPGATPAAPRVVTPSLPGVESLHARSPLQPQQQYAPVQPRAYEPAPQHYAPQPRAYEPPGPPTQMPSSEPMATAASAGAVAVTASPPATAQLSEPVPMPYASPVHQPVLAYVPEPEQAGGPRSMGTQASVAPPPSGQPQFAHGPSPFMLAPAPQALLAPAPSPVRGAAPHPMAGTMLDRTPSIPGGALPAGAAPAAALASSLPGGSSTRFEQVPSARGSLAQQATGFGLHIPIDQSASDWGRTGLEAAGAGKAKGQSGSQLRLILLAALALAAIGFATYGPQLLGGLLVARRERAGVEAGERGLPEDRPRAPDQATLTNLPSSAAPAASAAARSAAPAAASPSSVVSALAAAPPAPTPVAPAPAVSAPTLAAVPGVSVPAEPEEKPDPGDTKAAAAARKAAEAAATPESRLAAQAARRVLAARYADALPLYRQLQQSYPQNTAYAAMTRVLEQKVAASGKPGAQP